MDQPHRLAVDALTRLARAAHRARATVQLAACASVPNAVTPRCRLSAVDRRPGFAIAATIGGRIGSIVPLEHQCAALRQIRNRLHHLDHGDQLLLPLRSRCALSRERRHRRYADHVAGRRREDCALLLLSAGRCQPHARRPTRLALPLLAGNDRDVALPREAESMRSGRPRAPSRRSASPPPTITALCASAPPIRTTLNSTMARRFSRR